MRFVVVARRGEIIEGAALVEPLRPTPEAALSVAMTAPLRACAEIGDTLTAYPLHELLSAYRERESNW